VAIGVDELDDGFNLEHTFVVVEGLGSWQLARSCGSMAGDAFFRRSLFEALAALAFPLATELVFLQRFTPEAIAGHACECVCLIIFVCRVRFSNAHDAGAKARLGVGVLRTESVVASAGIGELWALEATVARDLEDLAVSVLHAVAAGLGALAPGSPSSDGAVDWADALLGAVD
jgi:hypothetical protein